MRSPTEITAGPPSLAHWDTRKLAILFATICSAKLISYAIQTFSVGPWTVPDDTRQFLSWAHHAGDMAAIRSDLIFSYWYDMSPPAYRTIYTLLAEIGVDPRTFSVTLGFGLFVMLAWGAWRLGQAFATSSIAAFFAASFVVVGLVQLDYLFSATPRAFAAPATLFFLDGLMRRKNVQAFAAISIMAIFYPAVAIAGLGMIGLTLIRLDWRRPFTLSVNAWIFAALSAVVVFGAILLFGESTGRWGSTLTLEQAFRYPSLAEPFGRNSIVNPSGNLAVLCGNRMGFIPNFFGCSNVLGPLIPALNAVVAIPFVVALITAVRKSNWNRPQLVLLWALVSAIVCYTIAFAVAFQLHLPGRYSQTILAPLVMLAFGAAVGNGFVARVPDRTARLDLGAGAAFAALLLAIPSVNVVSPDDSQLIYAVGALPEDARIAAISDDADYFPELTGRRTFATAELSIPYKLKYYREMLARLKQTASALRSESPETLSEFIRSQQITHIVVEGELLETGLLPQRFWSAIPDVARETGFSPFLASIHQACTLYEGRNDVGSSTFVLDADCLAERAVANPV